MGSTLFFAGDDGVHGSQLWSTNGTSAGTAMVDDINGGGGSDPADLLAMKGALYFPGYTTATGFQLWQTNGTPAGGDGHQLGRQCGHGPDEPDECRTHSVFHRHGQNPLAVENTVAVTPTIAWTSAANIVYGAALSPPSWMPRRRDLGREKVNVGDLHVRASRRAPCWVPATTRRCR